MQTLPENSGSTLVTTFLCIQQFSMTVSEKKKMFINDNENNKEIAILVC